MRFFDTPLILYGISMHYIAFQSFMERISTAEIEIYKCGEYLF